MKLFAYFSLLLLASCSSLKKQNLPEEYFVDSINIGKRTFNKIEISRFRVPDSVYVVINFYIKQDSRWLLQNSFHFQKDGVLGCDPKISDFNNDGFKDFNYVSTIAARGANEVRRLFIYDQDNDKLVYIRNSEDYPNLMYNQVLNCIDAFMVYGGCMTVFLELENDSLKPFVSVELMDALTIREIDKKGNEKIIFQDTTDKSAYIRYKNYRPLTKYDGF